MEVKKVKGKAIVFSLLAFLMLFAFASALASVKACNCVPVTEYSLTSGTTTGGKTWTVNDVTYTVGQSVTLDTNLLIGSSTTPITGTSYNICDSTYNSVTGTFKGVYCADWWYPSVDGGFKGIVIAIYYGDTMPTPTPPLVFSFYAVLQGYGSFAGTVLTFNVVKQSWFDIYVAGTLITK